MSILLSSAAVALLMAQALAAATGGSPPRVIEAVTYPEECVRKAARIETVVVAFDTTAMGEPLKTSIVTSTNSCLNEAALTVLTLTRFLNSGENAGLNPRRNLRASIVFDRILSPSSPERQFRRNVKKRFDRVLKGLRGGNDPAEALERLVKIEEKYGDEFSLAEFAVHRMLCAAARSGLGDEKGALQDLHAAKETGLMDVTFSMTGLSMPEIESEVQSAKQ